MSINIQEFDLFLFDFDGLLVDTEPLHYKAYKSCIEDYGLLLDWTYETYCHYAHLDIHAEALYRDLPLLKKIEPDWQKIRARKGAHYSRFLLKEPIALMPGVEEFIATLDKPVCVVTNSRRSDVTLIRENSPFLKSIATWITRDDYHNPKPAPDGYLKALSHFNIPAKKAVGFEDTLKGAKSLHAAGVKPVLICLSTHPQLKEKCGIGYTHCESFHDIIKQTC